MRTVRVCTYTLSLGVMGEMGSTMVGVFTPLRFERAPPVRERGIEGECEIG